MSSTDHIGAGARWTEQEIRAAVSAYVEMLRAEESGEPVVKSRVVESLRAGALQARSRSAVEYRMQNISAVLDAHGRRWIHGFKPLSHVGAQAEVTIIDALRDIAPTLMPDARAPVSPYPFIEPALRWEQRTKKKVSAKLPNVADTGSASSIAISTALYSALGVDAEHSKPGDAGTLLEAGVQAYLAEALPQLDRRPWQVERPGREMTATGQYSHFEAVRQLIRDDEVLRASVGFDYLVKPDVTVVLPRRFNSAGALHPDPAAPLLHACVSCKWTLRSDRAQNVRTEAAALIRHRSGRLPHIVVVTAEPTAGRIASIAQGTGEIDAVFHIALPQLKQAMRDAGYPKQATLLADLEGQGRIYDLAELPAILAE
jgi:hypothetical protein